MPKREPNEYEQLVAEYRRKRLRALWPGWKLLWALPFVAIGVLFVAIPSLAQVVAGLVAWLVLVAAVVVPVVFAVVDGGARGYAWLVGAGVATGVVTLVVAVNSSSWAHDDGLGQAFMLVFLFWGVVAYVVWVGLVAAVGWFVRRLQWKRP